MGPKNISDNFDLKSALARFSQDYELLDEAIAIFKEEAPKHLEGIISSLAREEFKDASNYAHTLKSECGAVGAMKAYSVSWEMERTAGNGDIAAAQEIIQQLEKEITLAINYLPESSIQEDVL